MPSPSTGPRAAGYRAVILAVSKATPLPAHRGCSTPPSPGPEAAADGAGGGTGRQWPDDRQQPSSSSAISGLRWRLARIMDEETDTQNYFVRAIARIINSLRSFAYYKDRDACSMHGMESLLEVCRKNQAHWLQSWSGDTSEAALYAPIMRGHYHQWTGPHLFRNVFPQVWKGRRPIRRRDLGLSRWRRVLLDLLFPPATSSPARLLEEGEGHLSPHCVRGPYPWDGGGGQGRGITLALSPLPVRGVRQSIPPLQVRGTQMVPGPPRRADGRDASRRHLDGRFDALAWVPLSQRRRKERGATTGPSSWHGPWGTPGDGAGGVLCRGYATPRLSPASPMGEGRRANVQDAYRCIRPRTGGRAAFSAGGRRDHHRLHHWPPARRYCARRVRPIMVCVTAARCPLTEEWLEISENL